MKQLKISFIAIALVVLIPILTLLTLCLATPSQYGETFLGELSAKFDRLNSVEGEKVILIGGSSLAFGLDSKTMEEYLDRPVVNFGLYATLGTKVMLDLSRSAVGRGDIIVICPEIDAQTLSLYYNAESMWQAVDSDYSLLFHIGFDNIGDMAGGFWDYLAKKLEYARGDGLSVSGVYTKAAFNEYGDIVYERPYNQMALGYDPNKMIELSGDVFDDAFIEYLNDYVRMARRRGAEVYFSFPPMNADAVTTTDEEAVKAFYQYLYENLECEIISSVNDYVLDSGYFYDSNFHLNDAGVPIRTLQLVEDIRRAIGNTEAVEIVYPDVPEVPETPDIENGENLDFTDTASDAFTYEDFGKGLLITGVTDALNAEETIVIPQSHDGKAILAIGEGAFADADSLKTLVVNGNIVQIYDGFLSGCDSIKEIYLYNSDCNSVSIGAELLSGINTKPTIKVPYEAFGNYVADYFWGIYAGSLSVINTPDGE